MTTLCLDLATKTGWAVAVPPYRRSPTDIELQVAKPPQHLSGMIDLSVYKTTDEYGRMFMEFESWLCLTIATHDVDKIVIEEPIPFHKSFQATKVAVGLWAVVEKEAVRLAIPMWHINNSKLKTLAMGPARKSFKRGTKPKDYDKQAMMDRGMARGWTFRDDNECDALWLAEYAGQVFAGLTPEKIAAATEV